MKPWAIGLLAGVSAGASAAPEIDRAAPSSITAISRAELEKLPVNRNFSDLLKACPAQTLPSVRPGSQVMIDGFPAREQMDCVRPDDVRMIEIYKGHNDARAQYGSPPLVWDPALAAGAANYARQLTTLGRVHAPREGRKDVRENLLQSLNGQRSPKEMVKVWTAESQYFKYGVFPNVSTTGDWSKVGHYSQMIWPTTTRLGCAIHSDAKFDWTVCRYSPPGNRDGSTLLAAPLPVIRCKVDLRLSGSKPYWDSYYDFSDHLPVKAEFKDGPKAKAGGAAANPPPESILDDVGDNAAAPPSARPCPAPLPKTDTSRIHDTPMPQPIGPATATPLPTAADPLPPYADEFAHPLRVYFDKALDEYRNWPVWDMSVSPIGRELARRKMLYAYEEMLKRLKAAKKAAKAAGRFSSVDPKEVQKTLDYMREEVRKANLPPNTPR